MILYAPQNQGDKPMKQSGKQMRGAGRLSVASLARWAGRLSVASLARGFSRHTSAARSSPHRRGGFLAHTRRSFSRPAQRTRGEHSSAPPRASACRNIEQLFCVFALFHSTFFHVYRTVARRAVLLDTIRNNSRIPASRPLFRRRPHPPFVSADRSPAPAPPRLVPHHIGAGAGLCFSCPPAAAIGLPPWFWGALSTIELWINCGKM